MSEEFGSLVAEAFWGGLAVFALVLVNGFFVAAEFALVSVRRSRIDEMVAQGVRSANIVRGAIHDLDRYIAGTQVGITIASLALGWVGEPALVHLIQPALDWLPVETSPAMTHTISVAIAFALITFLHVVLGELVPKSLALQKPEAVSLWIGRPLVFAVAVFQPLIWALNGVGNWLLRLIGFSPAGEHHGVHSVDELEILVRQSHAAGVLDDLEQQMLQRTFRFSELAASEVMIPRMDIVALDLTRPMDDLIETATQTIHRRLPVYEGSMDQIVGILYVQDLFKRMRHPDAVINLREIVRPAFAVPETVHLDALLEQFKERRTQIAIVVDEFGSMSGMITLEDIVDEVFGEMQDALEAEQPTIQHMPDGRFLVRGEVRLDEIEERAGWQISDDDVDTIAGYVMNRLGRVARLHDMVETPYGSIRVVNMARMRITQVALIPKPPEPVPGAPTDTTPSQTEQSS